MKIVFICMDYYPYEGACTSLLRKLLYEGNLQKKIEHIDIISVKKQLDERSLDTEKEINIHRCLPVSLLNKKNLLHVCRRNPFRGMAGLFSKTWIRLTEALFSKKMLNKDVMNSLKRQLAKLDINAYDAIIPICGCYEAAAAIMEYFPEVCSKMILYQVDPCGTNAKYSGRLVSNAVAFEKKLYQKAAAIITTPIIYREMLEKYSQEILSKTYEMEFPNISAERIAAFARKTSKIRCVFAGSIYAVARNPRYTIALFNAIHDSDIELHMVGVGREKLLEFTTEEAIKNVVFHGKLPLSEAQDRIRNADILVNIGNIMTNQVPSKIFEYISACKPIVNICVNENCPSLPYLEKYPLSKSVVEGVGTLEENAKTVEDFIRVNAGKTVDQKTVLDTFEKCTAKYCASLMLRVIKSVCGNPIG